jgi:hypothetical protein
MTSTSTDPARSESKREWMPDPSPYGWWFGDCPKHGRTPHISLLGGVCERCAAEQEARSNPFRRTRQ